MLDNDLLNLTHEQQQRAVEKIQELMAQGTRHWQRRSYCLSGKTITGTE